MGKEQKIVLVTGAANGIGLTITEYLTQKGDHVIATDIDEKALNELKGRENISTLLLDITNLQSIKDAKEKILEISEGIDGLVNNAGLFVGGPLIEVSEKKMQKIIDVNVIGTYKVTKALYPLILARKGRIINIGSEAGRIAFPLNGPYSMSKFALEAFSDALRREVMFQGIKVVHLQAGAIKTDLLEKIYCTYAEDIDIEKTMFRNLIEQVIVTCEKELEKGSDPKHVAKAVYKALHKKRVKARYKVKNHKTRRLLEFLPTSIIDYAIMKMLK